MGKGAGGGRALGLPGCEGRGPGGAERLSERAGGAESCGGQRPGGEESCGGAESWGGGRDRLFC